MVESVDTHVRTTGLNQDRLQEGIAAAGVELQGPPDIKEFPVHETLS